MTTNQPTPGDRQEVRVAGRIAAQVLRRWAETGRTDDGEAGTFEEVGQALAERLDRAGLITRSE